MDRPAREQENEGEGDDSKEINESRGNASLSAEINNSCSDDNSELEDKYNTVNFASTNARSLAPKIISMVESFRELRLNFFAITETWFKNDRETKREIESLLSAEKIKIATKNRGARGGGVALAFDTVSADFKVVKLAENKYEILCCVGSIDGVGKKVAVLVVYIPPQTNAATVEKINEFIGDSVETIIEKYDDPHIVITGDFNKKNVTECLGDFPEIQLIQTPATRGEACLDKCYSNLTPFIKNSRVLPPLESNDGTTESDHKIIMVHSLFTRIHVFKKRKIRFRPYTKRGEKVFGELLINTDWSYLDKTEKESATLMAERLDEYVSIAFPEKTRTYKSTDKPWITKEIKLLTRRKRREYARNRRSIRWRALEDETERLILQAKERFFGGVTRRLVESKNTREYFRAVAALSKIEGTERKEWSIYELFPDKNDKDIAEHVAEFFNKISAEYQPLQSSEAAPLDCTIICPPLHEISSRLKYCRKPKSRVPGDIPPELVKKYHDLLAIPLGYVFRDSFKNSSWPSLWKKETVTVIPKVPRPSGLGELRNLSCTPLFSKVMEFFILKQLQMETKLRASQFGGIKGSSVDHFLIETWDQILRALEDGRAAANLISIDFEKAFNRVDHHECLKACQKKGATPSTLAMVRAFLTERTMSVKIGEARSTPRRVNGGSPQGSILANYLFCVTTDQLGECAEKINEQAEGERTASFDNNGVEIGEHDGAVNNISPIQRPVEDIELGTSDEEEEVLASHFIHFRPRNRLYDSENEVSEVANQSEINRVFGIPEGWLEHPIETKVYIDDLNAIEKIIQTNSVSTITQSKRILKVHAPKSEELFEELKLTSDRIKMKINQRKTQMLCISASIHDNIYSYIRPVVDGKKEETKSAETLKIIGFNFSTSPTVSLHVEIMRGKFRSSLWSLRQLKRSGMKPTDMLNVYKSALRPVLEFACVTFGPMLSRNQVLELERLQLKSMKIIYGPMISYGTVLKETGICTLENRRDNLIKKFALKTVANKKFSEKWFPKNPEPRYNIRNPKIYVEENCRTERLYRSPIFTMRRILNTI